MEYKCSSHMPSAARVEGIHSHVRTFQVVHNRTAAWAAYRMVALGMVDVRIEQKQLRASLGLPRLVAERKRLVRSEDRRIA